MWKTRVLKVLLTIAFGIFMMLYVLTIEAC